MTLPAGAGQHHNFKFARTPFGYHRGMSAIQLLIVVAIVVLLFRNGVPSFVQALEEGLRCLRSLGSA